MYCPPGISCVYTSAEPDFWPDSKAEYEKRTDSQYSIKGVNCSIDKPVFRSLCSSAQAIAPTAGRVVFAGPYRDYGQILIIDHGGGWTTLITGLHRLTTRVGDAVRQGDPVGVTGARRSNITVELRRNGRPVDIIPLVGLA